MVCQEEIFSHSGPSYLDVIDWNDVHHRRCVAASLVQGAYISEKDRQQKRNGPQALAPPWWEFFHFQLLSVLVDDTDLSIFATIYKYNSSSSSSSKSSYKSITHSAHSPPKYVVAFRGTLLKRHSMHRDLELDLKIIRNGLHKTSRLQLALRTIQNMVLEVGASNIWLAGHSLGAAIGMLIGKDMAKLGYPLQCYLFNPPYVSAPLEKIKDTEIKHQIRWVKSVIKTRIAAAVKDHHLPCHFHHHGSNHDNDVNDNASFVIMSSWFPNLFVNRSDSICSEYIGYFEHREKMEQIGAEEIERIATQVSMGNLFLRAVGKGSEPFHLLPSAHLIINQCPSPDLVTAHGIKQWWGPEYFHLNSKLHQFK